MLFASEIHCRERLGCLHDQGSLTGGQSPRQLIERLAVAVWQANGAFCTVTGRTTCLEDLPYETHVLDKIDYDQAMGSKTSVATPEATAETSDINLLETFRCPDCHEKTSIEEVLAEATVISRLHSVEADGRLNYDLPTRQRKGSIYYQCAACGHLVAQTPTELVALLQQMAKEAGVL
jgi:hypothetical protein